MDAEALGLHDYGLVPLRTIKFRLVPLRPLLLCSLVPFEHVPCARQQPPKQDTRHETWRRMGLAVR